MNIVPALLNKSAYEFLEQIDKLKPYYNYFQIDIADGKFVPNTTISIDEIADAFSKVQPAGLMFDFHLMVEDYLTHIEAVKRVQKYAVVKNILVHHGVLHNQHNMDIAKLKMPSNLSLGLVLNPEDLVDTIIHNYDYFKIPTIQIMTVQPGFQGGSFLPEMLNKIEQLRTYGYKLDIWLDGSINEQTITLINTKKYRPNFLGVGSYLSKSTNVELSSQILKSIAE